MIMIFGEITTKATVNYEQVRILGGRRACGLGGRERQGGPPSLPSARHSRVLHAHRIGVVHGYCVFVCD
jgi:hypothetical protein